MVAFTIRHSSCQFISISSGRVHHITYTHSFKMEFTIGTQVIGGSQPCFIVAEIGQNHQGDIDHAKQMIMRAKQSGVDCVKFQKSSLADKFTGDALARPYASDNSWGNTYGAHKAHLEFSIDQFRTLQRYATDEVGIMFSASAMDMRSLAQLYTLDLPFIKIGSGDANNFQLLQYAAAQPTPLIISTGMQSEATIRTIVAIMQTNGKHNYALMHCVSSYPTAPKDAAVRMVQALSEMFPNVCIGYSGHEQSTAAITGAAVVLGAKIVERHFTLDKSQKGTDHKLSLLPSEMTTMTDTVRAIESRLVDHPNRKTYSNADVMSLLSKCLVPPSELGSVELALEQQQHRKITACELECLQKLGKSLVYTRFCKADHVLTESDVCAKVAEPNGLSANRLYDIVGKTLRCNVLGDTTVDLDHF